MNETNKIDIKTLKAQIDGVEGIRGRPTQAERDLGHRFAVNGQTMYAKDLGDMIQIQTANGAVGKGANVREAYAAIA